VQEISKVNDSQIIVVGDTPRDIQCAQQYGLPIIAVATGNYTLNHLTSYTPSLTVKNFDEGINAITNFLKHIISV
jgi:phosphoglycolate phosphatase-like HAD superfamily hydrolase